MFVNQSVFEKFPVLETERIILREIRMQDAGAIYFMRSNDRINKYINRAKPEHLEACKELCQKCMGAFATKQGIGWTAVHKINSAIIGTCGFNKIDYENSRAEIGGEMSVDFWGKGFAKEAVEAIAIFGFNKLNLHSIEALVNPFNKSAIAVLENIGFKQEAAFRECMLYDETYHDMNVYGLLRSDLNNSGIC